MENENNKGNQFQLELKPEIAQGVYANFAIIANASSEFIMDFASFLPGMPKADVRARVIMAPEHAKRLLLALQQRVSDYELQFGKIDLNKLAQRNSTIAPFGTGEA